MDPSHLRSDVVMRVLDHWYARQDKQKAVLRFQQVLYPGHTVGPPSRFQSDPQTPQSPEKGRKRTVINHSEADNEADMSPNPQEHRLAGQDVGVRRPTVNKHAAGPGRSSQSWQQVDNVTPANHLPVPHQPPALSLPTSPGTQFELTGRDGRNEPSVCLLNLLICHLKST